MNDTSPDFQPAASLRRGLAGLLLSGLILALPGAILPLWGHHLTSEYLQAGRYFLVLNFGSILAIRLGRPLLKRLDVRGEMLLAAALAVAGFGAAIFASPPAEPVWREAALFVLGCAAGLLHVGVFQLIAPFYDRAPAATMNLGGILFGSGCLLAALLASAAAESTMLWEPFAIGTALALALMYWLARWPFSSGAAIPEDSSDHATRQGFRSPAAILFALLLFFQFGIEWSVAGWLALFLIQRLGISPQAALGLLALYWAALLLGRIAAQWMLPRVRHSRLLFGSVIAAALGCTMLGSTNNLFGAAVAILLLGGGFAMTYPLVVEKAGSQFSYFHPLYMNGIFSVALAGGLLAPWLTGWITARFGIGSAMLVPLVGTFAVFVLLLLIWLDAKLNPVE